MVREWIEVTSFKVLSNGLPITPLKTDGQSTVRNSVTTIDTQGCSPRVTASLMVPLGITRSLVNPYKREVVGLRSTCSPGLSVTIPEEDVGGATIVY